ncbi:MAG TPA: hypothetical protein PLS20_11780, partial [Ruminococcus flavefaciens]|nr:hypothetical protein [Ruminococcus flavefaciens]
MKKINLSSAEEQRVPAVCAQREHFVTFMKPDHSAAFVLSEDFESSADLLSEASLLASSFS